MAHKEVVDTKAQDDRILFKKNFVCDSEADIANLPECLPGSQAIVVNSGALFVVSASGEWARFGG